MNEPTKNYSYKFLSYTRGSRKSNMITNNKSLYSITNKRRKRNKFKPAEGKQYKVKPDK